MYIIYLYCILNEEILLIITIFFYINSPYLLKYLANQLIIKHKNDKLQIEKIKIKINKQFVLLPTNTFTPTTIDQSVYLYIWYTYIYMPLLEYR